jgi:hypothetical protein
MEVIRMEPEAPPHRTATAREVLYVLGKRKKDSKKVFFPCSRWHQLIVISLGGRVIVFNASFIGGEPGVPRKNHQLVASH